MLPNARAAQGGVTGLKAQHRTGMLPPTSHECWCLAEPDTDAIEALGQPYHRPNP